MGTIRDVAGAVESERRRWLALTVICIGYGAMMLDTTIVNTALPVIQGDLGFGASDLAWVVDAYLLTFGGLLLPAGRLGDLIGHKRVFVGGLTAFTIASLACGASQSQVELIAARAFQGIGAAFATAVIVAIIVRTFPEPRERAKAMTIYTLVVAGGSSLGLLLGGVLTQALSWHWVFFVNLPIGLLALVGAALVLDREDAPGLEGGVDVTGSLLVIAATVLGLYAIVEAPDDGWLSPTVLGCLAAALVGFGLFAAQEMRTERPILPASIVRSRPLLLGSLTRGLLFSALFGCFFLGALYFQNVLGYSAIGIGLAFMPWTATMLLLSAHGTSAKLMERYEPAVPMFGGIAAMVAGLAVLGLAGGDASYVPMPLLGTLLIGTGAGLALVPTLSLAMRDVPDEDAGIGSAFLNVATQLGGALGVAIYGSLAAERTSGLASRGTPHTGALFSGYQLGLLVSAGVVALGLVTALGLPRATTRA